MFVVSSSVRGSRDVTGASLALAVRAVDAEVVERRSFAGRAQEVTEVVVKVVAGGEREWFDWRVERLR